MSDNEDGYENGAPQEEEDEFEDSSAEESDDEDKFEEDDFIVDDVGDADDAGPLPPMRRDDDADDLEEIRKKKKKKKRRRYDDSHELAEGDLELLEEKGVRIDRKKKLRRLRKGAADEDDNFGLDDEVRGLADIEEEDDLYERRRQPEEPVDYDDEMDDFIDDGGRRRRRRAAERDGLVSSEAVRQARSIFGDVEEMTQYRGVDKLFQKGQEGDDDEDADYLGEDEQEDESKPLRTIRERDDDRFGDIDAMPDDEELGTQEANIATQLSGPGDDAEEVKRIVAMDVPEELQYHFGPDHRTPTDAELKEEGTWIYNHGFRDNPMFQDLEHYKPEAVTNRIVVVLSYIHIDKLDIPFIAMYRKDYITPFLIPRAGEILRGNPSEHDFEARGAMRTPRGFNSYQYDGYRPGISIDHLQGVPRGYDDGFGDWGVLWHILDLDKKFASMVKKRQSLLAATKEAAEKGVPSLVVKEVTTIIETCEDEQRLKDADAYLHLAVELADVVTKRNNALSDFMEEDDDDKRAKRPSRRKNRYTYFCKRGYRALAEEFGLSARQFGENFRSASQYGSGMQMHVPLDADDEPLEVAKVCADRLGESAARAGITDQKMAERLLNAARLILVTEIVADMQVMQTAREILCKPGTVSISTIPTRQGIAQVDDTHPLRPVTCLAEKKLESFSNTTDFALVMRAVNLGFTQLKVVLQPEQVAKFDSSLQSSFLVAGVPSQMVEKWNEERMHVVSEVKRIITKELINEITEELNSHTDLVLRSHLCQAASRRFLLGPGRPDPNDNGCPRVLSVSVTGEEDEEPDPLQVAKDLESAKGKNKMGGEKRIARERLTFVELDDNGEYQTGYEIFAGWLRRTARKDSPDSKLPVPIKDQLKAFISQSRAQVIVIGLGSGGRSVMRLQTDLIDIVAEMAVDYREGEDKRRPPMLHPREIEEIKKLVTEREIEDSTGNYKVAEEKLKGLRHMLSRYIILADEFPARIFARTEAASIGLSVDAMTLLEKRATGLGRLAQEPLWIYSAIGQDEESATHFKIHPYHYFAKPKERLIALQRALFRAVCTNGVDINRMLRLPHTQSLLRYISGLGVHKAKALLRTLEASLSEKDGGLPSRKHLWTEKHVGRTVFLSTAAFLRVRDPELHNGGSSRRAIEFRRARLSRKSRGRRRDDEGVVFDPMDDSRVHPEHYAVAIKIADEALRDDDGNLRVEIPKSEEHTEALRMTSAVLDDPGGLQRLALDEYADHLEKLGRGSLFETVRIIASEFQGPFKDHRIAMRSPEPAAVFYLVSGADPIMMRVGSVVAATNCQLKERRRIVNPEQRNIFGVSCFLPHNIRGYIPLYPQSQFMDDDRLSDAELKKLLPDGCSWRCRIMDFKFDRFEAVLTSRGSAIDNPESIPGYTPLVDKRDPAYRPYPVLDPQQEPNGARVLPLKSAEKTRKPSNPSLKRTTTNLRQNAKPVVHHPLFNEVTGDEAISMLQGGLPGDIIIRPSQYDRDGIIFSCKFATLPVDTDTKPRGVFHKDCQMQYDSADSVIPLRLKLDDVFYEDVDQVLEQYLRPIISNLAECLEHRKFRGGSVRDIEKFVSNEKEKAPKSIPYCFGLSEKNLTSLTLVFVPGTTTVHQEEVKVLPDGYRLRNVLHKNMDVLFTWFKSNMRRSTRRPTAAKETAGASPFPSTYASAASPYRAAASPYRSAASPYRSAASPFQAPKSPFQAPSSPFVGAARARPTQDAPPPPAPLSLSSRPERPDPYRSMQQERLPRGPFPTTSDQNPISADEWAKATLQTDEPPPSTVQNGSANGPPPPRSPPRRFDDLRGNGRGPGPAGPARGPPIQDGAPRGPHSRGPPPRGAPDGRRGGRMPEWRGAKPVPAWKKAQEQQSEQ